MAKLKINMEFNVVVSEKLADKVTASEEELVSFIMRNCFRNNTRNLITESVENISEWKPNKNKQ